MPGPGTYSKDYNVSSSIIQKNHAPAAVIVSRVVEKVKDNIPGPGAYQPDYKKLMKSSSGYKIGHSDKLGDIVG